MVHRNNLITTTVNNKDRFLEFRRVACVSNGSRTAAAGSPIPRAISFTLRNVDSRMSTAGERRFDKDAKTPPPRERP